MEVCLKLAIMKRNIVFIVLLYKKLGLSDVSDFVKNYKSPFFKNMSL